MSQIKKSEILFILNAASGNRKVSAIFKSIKKIDSSLSCIITSSVKEVKRVFEGCMNNYRVFVIVGGDGSVNEAIKYLHNKPDKYLAVYPNGSGNGFARELGFRRNIKALLKDIDKGDLMELDTIKINQYRSINTSGLGFDAHIAHAFAKNLSSILKWLTAFAIFSQKLTLVFEELSG